MQITFPQPSFGAQALAGPDQTGNLCVWPCEECLVSRIIHNKERLESIVKAEKNRAKNEINGKMEEFESKEENEFKGKMVIEVGSGALGLAGLAALTQGAKKVFLTDGNDQSVSNLTKILEINGLSSSSVKAQKLLWQKEVEVQLKEAFDFVLCADCLYFSEESRASLSSLLFNLLKKDGLALVAAPNRGKSRQEFMDISKPKFSSVELLDEVSKAFSPLVAERLNEMKKDPQFNEDKHWPALIIMRK